LFNNGFKHDNVEECEIDEDDLKVDEHEFGSFGIVLLHISNNDVDEPEIDFDDSGNDVDRPIDDVDGRGSVEPWLIL